MTVFYGRIEERRDLCFKDQFPGLVLDGPILLSYSQKMLVDSKSKLDPQLWPKSDKSTI